VFVIQTWFHKNLSGSYEQGNVSLCFELETALLINSDSLLYMHISLL
jgi:hypothetical protein